MIADYFSSEFFLIALTFAVFFVAKVLQKKTGLMLLNPILLTIVLLILFLKAMGITYETYYEGGHLIEFWLKPAVVALGVPLYLQLETIKKQVLPIILSQLAGCVVGIVSVVLVAKAMGASREIICSLAPKSVTTPHSYGDSRLDRRHTVAHGCGSGVCRSAGRYIGLQGHEADAHCQPDGAGAVDGCGRPCCRYFGGGRAWT